MRNGALLVFLYKFYVKRSLGCVSDVKTRLTAVAALIVNRTGQAVRKSCIVITPQAIYNKVCDWIADALRHGFAAVETTTGLDGLFLTYFFFGYINLYFDLQSWLSYKP